MKPTSLLTAALLPLGLMAAPLAEEAAAADIAAREPVDVSPREPTDIPLKRSDIMCQTVGASVVNCRAGPGTNYRVVATVKRGEWGIFSCVESGECITINGAKNCGWDYTPYAGSGSGCYINGHYTDSSCTLARLGRC